VVSTILPPLAITDDLTMARADFEAYFAVRETPETYAQLRVALSAPELRIAPPGRSSDEWLEELWWWLAQVA
jgi:hypothetical protein